LAGAGAFALACGGAVLLFAFWQARRSRDAFRKSPAYFRAVARSDDRSIHNMGDFFGAAAAIGTFIAVLVAAISSTGWVIGRTGKHTHFSIPCQERVTGLCGATPARGSAWRNLRCLPTNIAAANAEKFSSAVSTSPSTRNRIHVVPSAIANKCNPCSPTSLPRLQRRADE
jgi:hypothetical protein